jgi:hypothetical protein
LDSRDLCLSLGSLLSDQTVDSLDGPEVGVGSGDDISTDDGSNNGGSDDLSVSDNWSSDETDGRSSDTLDFPEELDSSSLSVDGDSLGDSSLNSTEGSGGSDSSGHGSSVLVSNRDDCWLNNSSDLSSSVVGDGELWGTDDGDGLAGGGSLDGSSSGDLLLSDLLINSLELGSGGDGLDDLLTISSSDGNDCSSDHLVGVASSLSDSFDHWSSDDSNLVGDR